MDCPGHAELFAPLKHSYAAAVMQTQNPLVLFGDAEKSFIAVNKGGYIAIKIDQQIYDQQLQRCQHALIARIVLAKGESPWKLPDLKHKLTKTWGISSSWKLISLGHGLTLILIIISSESFPNIFDQV